MLGRKTHYMTMLPTITIYEGVSIFPGEVFQPPRVWGERVYSRLFYWNQAAHGGHFAAFEKPGLFVDELRAAFHTRPPG